VSKEVSILGLWYLTCGNRAGTTAVNTPAAGTLDAKLDSGDPIGDEKDQAKAE
jgi:hypothetical protein